MVFGVFALCLNTVCSKVYQIFLKPFFILYISLCLALFDLKQRGLGNVYISLFNQGRHLPVKECEKKRPDMRAVHICVCHNNNLVIARLSCVKILLANACAKGSNERLYLIAA